MEGGKPAQADFNLSLTEDIRFQNAQSYLDSVAELYQIEFSLKREEAMKRALIRMPSWFIEVQNSTKLPLPHFEEQK